MFTIKTKKIIFILTLCFGVAPLKAMNAPAADLRTSLQAEDASSRAVYMVGSPITSDGDTSEKDPLIAVTELAKKSLIAEITSVKTCRVAWLVEELGEDVDDDDKKSLEEYSFKQLKNLKTALSLVTFNSVPSDSEELSPKSYYLMGFAAYQGTDWNGNVIRLLANGLKDRVADLCEILGWATGALDIFTTETLLITASLDIDMKVAVMKALSPRPAELAHAGYVAALQKRVIEASSIDKIPAVIEETRIIFFAAAREKFERMQTK